MSHSVFPGRGERDQREASREAGSQEGEGRPITRSSRPYQDAAEDDDPDHYDPSEDESVNDADVAKEEKLEPQQRPPSPESHPREWPHPSAEPAPKTPEQENTGANMEEPKKEKPVEPVLVAAADPRTARRSPENAVQEPPSTVGVGLRFL